MKNSINTEPMRGQVWVVEPTERHASSPAPLVLLWTEQDSAWTTLPILDDCTLACHRDVALSENPGWLEGNLWCMAKDQVGVSKDRLRAHVETVDAMTLGEVRSFRQDKECSLRTAHRLVPDLDDPRIKERAVYLAFVLDCAKESVWAMFIRWTEAATAFLKGPSGEETALPVAPLESGAMRGSSPGSGGITEIGPFDAGPYKLLFRLEQGEEDCLATIEAINGDISEITLFLEQKGLPLERVDNVWMTEDPLPSGVGFKLVLTGSKGGFSLDLPEGL